MLKLIVSLTSDALDLFLLEHLFPFPSLPLPSLSIFNFFLVLGGNFTFQRGDFLPLENTRKEIILIRKQQAEEEN